MHHFHGNGIGHLIDFFYNFGTLPLDPLTCYNLFPGVLIDRLQLVLIA